MPRAWKLVHGGGGDPHWFDYPTLLLYVNAPFQAWQDEPSFLTARIAASSGRPTSCRTRLPLTSTLK